MPFPGPALPAALALLSFRGVTKSFFGVTVLHGISFDLAPGQLLGLVGENGSGKSTAMNILGGVLQRDGGEITLDGVPYHPRGPQDAEKGRIAFIQQELNIFPNLSVEENLFLGRYPKVAGWLPMVARGQLHQAARDLLAQVELDVPLKLPAGALSPGERQLLEIAKALSLDARIIIFDEPTTSLTSRECERLFALIQRLRSAGISIIYISHVLADVMRLADHVLVLRDGHVVRDAPRAELTPGDLVSAMVGRSIETLFPERRQPGTGRRPMLEVHGLSHPGTIRDVTFSVGEGEIVGVAGLLGSGRTELARILFGLDPYERGQITLAGLPVPPGDPRACIDMGMAFLTEDRRHEGLMMDGTVAANLGLAALPLHARRGGRIDDHALDGRMATMREHLHIKTHDMGSTVVKTLSGGNQQKVVMGKWLLRGPRVFILDEPTRGIDVGAKQEIYSLISRLSEEGMAVLVISSELEELVGLCDRILPMSRGELAGMFWRGAFDREAIMRAAMGEATS